MKQTAVSVVIPAYNEETNIRLGVLDKVCRYLESQTYSWEVIVVNDGSTDMTGVLLHEFTKRNSGFQVIDNPHQGKASTVISGILAAKKDIILFTDLDQATPIQEIEKILPWFDKGYDVVIGSRRSKREGAPILRRLMAQGFILLRTIILGIKGISDTQCGFKAFKRNVAHEVCKRLALYGKKKIVSGSLVTAGFDIEVLYVATILGYKIKEAPVEWHYVETRRVNPIKDSWQGFRDIITIRYNASRGIYSRKLLHE